MSYTPTVTIYNKVMTGADTEYSQAIPAGYNHLRIQCQSANDIRFAWITGKVATSTAPYGIVKSGHVYETDFIPSARTLYVACAVTGQVCEIVCSGLVTD